MRRPRRARFAPTRPVTARRATRRPERVTVTVTLAGTVSENVTAPLRVSFGAPNRSAVGLFGAAPGAVLVEHPRIVSGALPDACSPFWLTNAAFTGDVPHAAGV